MSTYFIQEEQSQALSGERLLSSPQKMMAPVINRVQTAPASAHKNTIQESSGLFGGGFPNSCRMFLNNHKQNPERNETTRCVSLVCLCILCLQQCKSILGEESNDIFNGFRWPALGNVLFLLQYLLKIKSIYL